MPERPGLAAPPYFDLPDRRGSEIPPAGSAVGRMHLFRSVWFYSDADELAGAINEEALQRLERERGLFVGHTYLAAWKAKKNYLMRRALVEEQGSAAVLLPVIDEALARLEDHVSSGRLASLTWRDAGDRLLALENVGVHYAPDGIITIENSGDDAIAGLTLAVPVSGATISLDGVPFLGQRSSEKRTTFWLDVPPHARVRLQIEAGGRPICYAAADSVRLEIEK